MVDLLDDDGLMDVGERAHKTDPKAVTKELTSARRAIAPENSALGRWAETLGSGGESLRDVPDTLADECHLCAATGRNTCEQCSRKACASHFWVMFGLCKVCASEDGVKSWHKESAPEDSNWLA